MLMRLPRRGALALPFLLLPRPAPAAPPPPFPDWVGRTAKLSGTGWAARVLLARDGTGLMSLKLFFLCRPITVQSWRILPEGKVLHYARLSVLDPARLVEGQARIEGAGVRWIEAESRDGAFDGFAPPEEVRSCG